MRTFYFCSLLLLTFFIWGQGFFAPYQFDDQITPLKDPASQSLAEYQKNLSKTLRVVTKLSYALESDLSLKTAPQRRVFQFILIGIFVSLFFVFIQNKIKLNLLDSFLFSLVLVLHPAHAETFLSLAGRSTLLMMIFLLLGLIYLDRQILSTVFLALGVLSKELLWPFFLWHFFIVIKETKKYLSILFIILALAGILTLNSTLYSRIYYSLTAMTEQNLWSEQWAAPFESLFYLLTPYRLAIEIESSRNWSVLFMILSTMLFILIFYFRKFFKTYFISLFLIYSVVLFSFKLDPLALRSLSFWWLILILGVAQICRQINLRHLFFARIALVLMTFYCALWSFPFSKSYLSAKELWRDATKKTTYKTRPLINLAHYQYLDGEYVEAMATLEAAQKRNPYDLEVYQRLQALKLLAP